MYWIRDNLQEFKYTIPFSEGVHMEKMSILWFLFARLMLSEECKTVTGCHLIPWVPDPPSAGHPLAQKPVSGGYHS